MKWEELLERKHELEQILKARSMIYQVDAKEEAARAFNHPLDYYYHFEFNRWMQVQRRFKRKQSLVILECLRLGIPSDMPYIEFPHYRKRMGYAPKENNQAG
jgi:hypothetical protein